MNTVCDESFNAPASMVEFVYYNLNFSDRYDYTMYVVCIIANA